jgi:hypothetical protein
LRVPGVGHGALCAGLEQMSGAPRSGLVLTARTGTKTRRVAGEGTFRSPALANWERFQEGEKNAKVSGSRLSSARHGDFGDPELVTS